MKMFRLSASKLCESFKHLNLSRNKNYATVLHLNNFISVRYILLKINLWHIDLTITVLAITKIMNFIKRIEKRKI